MNWTEVMVSAGVGVVLSGNATTLRNRNKLNKISAILLVIIPIVVGNIIYYQYINPNGLRSGDRARIEDSFEKFIWRLYYESPSFYDDIIEDYYKDK